QVAGLGVMVKIKEADPEGPACFVSTLESRAAISRSLSGGRYRFFRGRRYPVLERGAPQIIDTLVGDAVKHTDVAIIPECKIVPDRAATLFMEAEESDRSLPVDAGRICRAGLFLRDR